MYIFLLLLVPQLLLRLPCIWDIIKHHIYFLWPHNLIEVHCDHFAILLKYIFVSGWQNCWPTEFTICYHTKLELVVKLSDSSTTNNNSNYRTYDKMALSKNYVLMIVASYDTVFCKTTHPHRYLVYGNSVILFHIEKAEPNQTTHHIVIKLDGLLL